MDFISLSTVQLLKTFSPNSHFKSTSLSSLSSPPLNCFSLRGLWELMHLTQMKEKMGIRVIPVDSGNVWGVDPLRRTWDFDSAAELKGLNWALTSKDEIWRDPFCQVLTHTPFSVNVSHFSLSLSLLQVFLLSSCQVAFDRLTKESWLMIESDNNDVR